MKVMVATHSLVLGQLARFWSVQVPHVDQLGNRHLHQHHHHGDDEYDEYDAVGVILLWECSWPHCGGKMVLMVMLMLFVIFFCGNVLNREKPSSLVPRCRGTASFSTQAPPPVPEQNTNLCTISAQYPEMSCNLCDILGVVLNLEVPHLLTLLHQVIEVSPSWLKSDNS